MKTTTKKMTQEELLIENKQLKERIEFLEKLVLQLTQKSPVPISPMPIQPLTTPSFPSDYKITWTCDNRTMS